MLQPKSSLVFIIQLSTHFFYMELLSGEILSSVYYTIIYPFLLYGITSNDGFPEFPGALIKALPLFHWLKILTIFDIYKLQVGKLVLESLNNIGPSQSIIEFTLASDIHGHNTRYAKDSNFYVKGMRTTQFGLKNL